MFFDPSIIVQPDFRQYLDPVSARASCNEYRSNPAINVKFDEVPVRYSTKYSSKQLEGFQIDTVSPYGAHVHTRVSGLTEGKMESATQVSIGGSVNPLTQTSCLWFESIEVVIRTIPTVHIASEHVNNKCRYRVTLEHEMKHVDVSRRLAREYAPKIKSVLMNEVRRLGVVGPGPAAQAESIRADMMKAVQQAVGIVLAEMQLQHRSRQQQVDTKAEYDSLSKMCGGKF